MLAYARLDLPRLDQAGSQQQSVMARHQLVLLAYQVYPRLVQHKLALAVNTPKLLYNIAVMYVSATKTCTVLLKAQQIQILS